MKNIGIVILATNAYFVLGIRLMKRLSYFYKGNENIIFYFYSDINPKDYLPNSIKYEWFPTENDNWLDGTNQKYKKISELEKENLDYIFYIDADTSVEKEFHGDFFLHDLVGVEHFGNGTWMKDKKNYERNPQSTAYIPEDTEPPQIYYHAMFWGGKKEKVIEICKELYWNQLTDSKIDYEPCVNDESHLNWYFHYNPPTKMLAWNELPFLISNKGEIEGNLRDVDLDVEYIKKDLLKYKNSLIDIRLNKVFFEKKKIPLVSCVCVTYDRAHLINELLYCFLAQDYENKELIIVNDQPNVEYRFNHPKVKIHNFKKRFKSLGQKRNFTKEIVHGEYLINMDDDDIYYSNHISTLVNFHEEHPEYDVVVSKKGHYSESNKNIIEWGIIIPYNGGCVKKQYYKTHIFSPEKSCNEDSDFIKEGKACFIEDAPITFHYRWGLNVHHMSGMQGDGKESYEIVGNQASKDEKTKIIELKPELSDEVKAYYR